MATISTTSNLSDMSAIVIADSIQNVEPAGPTNQLVNRFDIPQGSKQINLPIWGRMTASALTEGQDLQTAKQLAVTVRNLTATEHGVLTFMSKRLSRQNNESVLRQTGLMQGRAIGRLLESDLVTLFDGFSKTAPGAGLDGDLHDIAGAIAYLGTDNDSAFGPADMSDLSAVFHTEQIRRFVNALSGRGSFGQNAGQYVPTGMSEEIIKRHWRGTDPLYNVPLYQSGVISRDSSGDSKGAIFSKLALALAISMEVDADEEKDISARGTEMVTVWEWGESESVDPWGVEFYSATDAWA